VTRPGPGGVPDPPPYRTPYRLAPDNPWWIAPFLGRVPALAPLQLQMLGAVSLAMLFENYDQAMLTAAARQIALSFGLQESSLASLFWRVHLGSVAAFLLVPFADRIGRRRLFLASLVGLSLATFLTAFTQSIGQFIALQMLARAFMVTCSATSFVIITEEFPAAHRGWGIGMLGALGAMGYGLGLLLFAAIDVLPFGWRALYVVGMTPLCLLPRLRRRVPETRRFEAHRVALGGGGASGWWRPFARLALAYPARAAAVAAIAALASAGQTTAFSFAAFFVQTQHGWSPGAYSGMAVAAGALGIVGHPWAGRVADLHGRRRVGFALMAAFPILALGFYHGPSWALPLMWIPLIFSLTGTATIERALATELFPTSYRGTASGWLQLMEAVGRVSGLALVDWGTAAGGSSLPMIDWVVFGSLLAGLVVLLVPETGRRELETISADEPDAAPAASGVPKREGAW